MINRDELLKMAREAGFLTGEMKMANGLTSYPIVIHSGNHCALEVERLINIVLERAAAEFNQPHMEYFGHEIQEAIRAIKTQGE